MDSLIWLMKKIPKEKKNREKIIFRKGLKDIEKKRKKERKRKARLFAFKKRISVPERFANKRQKVSTFLKLSPPASFSFIKNTEDVINYFDENGKRFNKGNNVNFDLRKIKFLSFDALSLLLAKINDENYTNCFAVKGKFPEDEGLKELFFKSGFFPSWWWNWDSQKCHGQMVWNFSNKKVLGSVASQITEKIIWDRKSEISKKTYSAFIECMANTNNHTKCKRWITYYEEEDHTKVCFIDLWCGILKHIKAKALKVLKLFNINFKKQWVEEPALILRSLLDNKDILDHRSWTKLPYRGTGMPRIREYADCKGIENFTIICNNLFANISLNQYNRLEKEFKWTFYYREIKKF